MDDMKVAYKVECPVDGSLLLKHSGLHVILRTGQEKHVLTFFCPSCNEQRYHLITKGTTRLLVDEMKVSYTVVRIPPEALEAHRGSPITETEVLSAVRTMDKVDWTPKLL